MQSRLLLEKLPIDQLRQVARHLGVSGWYSFRRHDLTDRLAMVPAEQVRDAIEATNRRH
jgi:hypothetical protein